MKSVNLMTRPTKALPVLLALLAVVFVVPPSIAAAQDPDQQEAQRQWQEAWEHFQNGEYDTAAQQYIDLGNRLPAGEMKAACFYNAACAYSLKGDKEPGAVWFAAAVKAGFRDLEHIGSDTDLDNIRDEAMSQKVIGLLTERRFEELDNLDVDALRERYYGAGAQQQPDNGGGLTDEQRERLEALRRMMYEEIDRDLTATRNRLRRLVDEMINKLAGEAGPEPAPSDQVAWLGVKVKSIDDAVREFMGIPAGEGVIVDDMPADSPARRAGVMKLDVLLRAADEVVRTPDDLTRILSAHKPGDRIGLVVLRSGERKTITVTLGGTAGNGESQPDPQPQPQPDQAPLWYRDVPSEPGTAIYGVGSGAGAEAADDAARADLMERVREVFRTGTRRYLMSVVDRMQIRNLETYLDEMQAAVLDATSESAAQVTTAGHAGASFALWKVPFDALQAAVVRKCGELLRNLGNPAPRIPEVREALREAHHEKYPPVAPPASANPGEKIPALEGGVLGLRVAAGTDGLHVRDVVPQSPAAASGLQANDVISHVDGVALSDLDSLRAVLEKRFVGDTLTLRVSRNGERHELELTIGRRR